ncbi:MAG: RNA-dependent RNA polymerase [Sanya levivirus 3]|uniref:RNA-directed RNA polymerase n=1 Tax=Sanya levivirus 3 TaxID=2905511 RepID=A0A8K1XXQ8_9VIRU|nr:MAG: RNA-dependent RNA polymerase [Sanya levivirus 3]
MNATTLFQEYVDRVNHTVDTFITDKRNSVVPLGPAYSKLTSAQSHSALRLYRMCKKWSRPSPSDSKRASSSVEEMFAYDSNGLSFFSINDVPEGYLRYQLNKTRFSLRDIFKGFKLDLSLFDMPSGETSLSSRGDVSIYSKLSNLSQWRCSPSNFTLFASICYSSPGLKRCARAHFKSLGLKMTREEGEKGYDCFARYLKRIITFVDVSRITTVPKNAEVDRVILCEPMCNMIVQRCIAKNIVSVIDNHFGIDLYNSQVVHQSLISDPSNATIDLSNASNSNWYSVIKYLLQDTCLLDLLERSRIATCSYKETYHHLNMIAPMGNGFTFEVMTLILLTLCREFDSMAHVFGDDIIVDNTVAGDVISLLESIGYQVNTSKTFIDSPFRESCGGFYHDTYITSFDFWWADDVVGAVTLVNKLFYLQQIDDTYCDLYRELVHHCPTHLLGAVLYYTSWKVCPTYNPHKAILLDSCNLELSSHVIVHPSYLQKRRKSLDEKQTRRSRDSTKFVRIENKRLMSQKKFNFLLSSSNPFLESHCLYVGKVIPTLRKAVTLIRNRK